MELVKFVKKYLPLLKETGLDVRATEFSLLSGLKDFEKDGILQDFEGDDEGMLDFLLMFAEIKNAYEVDFEGLTYDGYLWMIQELSGNKVVFEDAKYEVDSETEESGQGTGLVSFSLNGKKYEFEARVLYDWIDEKFMHYVNTVLEEQGIEKRAIMFGNHNSCMLTFKEPEWASRVKELLPIEADVL